MQANSRRAFGMVAQTSPQDARTARTEAAVTFDTLYLSALRESLELVAIKNYAKKFTIARFMAESGFSTVLSFRWPVE